MLQKISTFFSVKSSWTAHSSIERGVGSKHMLSWAEAVIEREPESELAKLCVIFKEDLAASESTPGFPENWKPVSDEELENELMLRELPVGRSMAEVIAAAREIEARDRVELHKTESLHHVSRVDAAKVRDYVAREFVVEQLLRPVNASRFEWHPCWKHIWAAKKDFAGMRRAYEGSPEQWLRLLRVRGLDAPSLNAHKYVRCFLKTDEAANDELLLEVDRRERLMKKVREESTDKADVKGAENV